MKSLGGLILRIVVAAPITVALLLFPFLIGFLVQDRLGISIPSAFLVMAGLALAFSAFFAIAGKQMKKVDSEWKARRSKS